MTLIRDLEVFSDFERPLYVGISRKSFIGEILDRDVKERDVGTVAANATAILAGASVLRVHNVPYTRDLIKMLAAVLDGVR